jgi:hypothetical protein
MEEEIINLYKDNGYTPEQVIKELTGLLGFAILTHREKEAHYNDRGMSITVMVEEIK